MSARRRGVKVVRKVLADGTVREYRYDRAAMAAKREAASRANGIRVLADAYMKTPEFRALSEPWRKATRYYVALIETDLGWMTLDDLSDRRARREFLELRNALADLPAKADKTMNVLRTLLSFGYEYAIIEANHAHKIGKLTKDGRRRDKIWTQAHIDGFLSVATAPVKRLFLFALYTAARQSDLCALRLGEHYDGRWLSFQPSKTLGSTGAWVHLPVFALDPLAALLANGDPLTEKGKFWSPENIRREWRLTKARADMDDADLTFHDLRGTAVTQMLEAGCSDAEVAAITGHSLGAGSKLGDYAARTKTLALHAYQKWNAAMNGGAEIVRISGIGNRSGN